MNSNIRITAKISPPNEIYLESCWRVRIYEDGRLTTKGIFTGTQKSAERWAKANAHEVKYQRSDQK